MIHASTQTKKSIVSSDWFSLPIVSICDLKSPVVNKSGWEKKQWEKEPVWPCQFEVHSKDPVSSHHQKTPRWRLGVLDDITLLL
jgi:hypothetical protein